MIIYFTKSSGEMWRNVEKCGEICQTAKILNKNNGEMCGEMSPKLLLFIF